VAATILERGRPFAHLGQPALVNGAAGVVVADRCRTFSVVDFTIENDHIVEIDVVANPAKLRATTGRR
jgi:hypothetical protein